jgi:SAM domain (Sterile alpha motif)/EF-hand domain pair/EF hand
VLTFINLLHFFCRSQYAQNFQDASVDGVLLLLLTDNLLEKNMGITTELHKLKLTKHIQRLCDGQLAYEKKMLPAVITPKLESKDTKLVRKKHRKKKSTHPSQRTQNLKYGWTSGHDSDNNDAAHAGIARVKVQRLLREKHADDSTAAAATLKEQELWRYAYDGTPCPGTATSTAVTSDAFASAMSSVRKDVLQDAGQATAVLAPTHGMAAAKWMTSHNGNYTNNDGDASVPIEARVKRGRDGRRFIPANATTQDVLAVVKQAMWEAADVLWSQRSLEDLQRQDSDLDSYDNGLDSSTDRHAEQDKVLPQCRMTMLFHEFVGLRNNGAHWLGSNHKLTRLKLEGGLATLLKLELAWEQFDAMFNFVDTRRSGTLSAREFAIAFGRQEDIAMYGTTTATNTNGSSYGSPTRRRIAAAAYGANGATQSSTDAVSSTEITQHELQVLKETLIGVAQTLLILGLTLGEIWATFDRNGSGEVSVSEFTSLMKQLCGGLTKRQIFLMLSCIDVSGDRQISLQELRNFFYAAWTARLSTLKSEHVALKDQGLQREAQVKYDRANKLRDAIRLNFDRAFRDVAADNGAIHLHGPFSALLQRMDLQPDNAAVAVSPTRSQWMTSVSPSPPPSSSKPRRRAQALKAGRNELIRCRLASAHTREPRRDDIKLSLPDPVNISALPLNTVQNEQAIVERGIWKTYAVML